MGFGQRLRYSNYCDEQKNLAVDNRILGEIVQHSVWLAPMSRLRDGKEKPSATCAIGWVNDGLEGAGKG